MKTIYGLPTSIHGLSNLFFFISLVDGQKGGHLEFKLRRAMNFRRRNCANGGADQVTGFNEIEVGRLVLTIFL